MRSELIGLLRHDVGIAAGSAGRGNDRRPRERGNQLECRAFQPRSVCWRTLRVAVQENKQEAARPKRRGVKVLGPGLITGASDDDPSGIGTYSQIGAQFGYGMLWTMLLSYPLMSAFQEICARIGRVTGHGIARNIRLRYPQLLYGLVALMVFANIFNLGADLQAMGAAARLLVPVPRILFAVLLGAGSVLAQLFVPYSRYVKYLKWMTFTLFAYVIAAFS